MFYLINAFDLLVPHKRKTRLLLVTYVSNCFYTKQIVRFRFLNIYIIMKCIKVLFFIYIERFFNNIWMHSCSHSIPKISNTVILASIVMCMYVISHYNMYKMIHFFFIPVMCTFWNFCSILVYKENLL